MAPRMTLAEIERAFPRQWVVAIDIVRDGAAVLEEGVVVFHSRDRDKALGMLKFVGRPAACWFVGRPRQAAGDLLGVVL
ncbi:MAG: hypothetical protein JXB32_11050 [Deltaproteobacteria bacterium]|nr:hypothetical protein [Deltaproteobacteria bacterium]